MTPPTTLQFIAQVKLGELRRQRELLQAEYNSISSEASGKPVEEAISILHQGLAKVRVANNPLHPELGNLHILLGGAPTETTGTLLAWRGRLERELRAGQLRTDIVYLFGALLGEWDGQSSQHASFAGDRQAHQQRLLEYLQKTPDSHLSGIALLERLFDTNDAKFVEAKAGIAKILENGPPQRHSGIAAVMHAVQNPYEPSAIRAEAKRLKENEVLLNEFGSALSVLWRTLPEWSWPAAGVTTRVMWTRNKWRLYPNLSLVDQAIVEAFGRLWSGAIEEAYGDLASSIARLGRWQKLRQLKSPAVIMDNEARLFERQRARLDLGWYERVDAWDGTVLSELGPKSESAGSGILCIRAVEQERLRMPHHGGYYGGDGADSMLRLVNAEVRTLLAAYPDKPLFVAKLDIQDFFASIPHPVILAMLRGLGLGEPGVAAIARYLAVPYVTHGRPAPARRGVPMAMHLSHWLAEWLLRVMERHVHQHAKVRIIRQIDDICMLAASKEEIVRAWRAAADFLGGCGLTLNTNKCGVLALGAETPEELPRQNPCWGLLEMGCGGAWAVNAQAFAVFCQETRRHVGSHHALLAKVELYNISLQYLAGALGLELNLGVEHRAAICRALQQFDANFFGPGIGVIQGIRKLLQERYLQGMQMAELPEAWMYWPLTAGGLGLRSSMILLGQVAVPEKPPSVPSSRPQNWQADDSEWTAWYKHHLTVLQKTKPRESNVMKALVNDFINRGKEISAGQQQTLSDYWRWILLLHGPEIIEKFGTFRFLLTDLVPLQLIREHLGSAGAHED